MSAAAIVWAWERRGLDLLPRLVLLALADFTNSKCDVTVPVVDLYKVLSQMTERSAAEVESALQELADRALIEAAPEGRGYSLLADPRRLRYGCGTRIINQRGKNEH